MVENLTMLVDFYELSMMNGYLENGMADEIVYFDYYFRTIPDKAGFALFSGLTSLIEYIRDLKFDDSDIEYLKKKGMFSDAFIERLRNFKFTADIWSMPEGSPIFPNEPIVTVRGKVFEVQLIETALLLFCNHQSLITTKANRIVRSAGSKPVYEFGARRAQGYSAAIVGARAAYIGGCAGTSNAISEILYDVPASGTMAHSWVQLFDSEYEAFKAYAEAYPDSTLLLVDTFNVVKSGVPNAIKVFDEVLKPLGKRPLGIRIDSGDIAYLSKLSRKMLDEAGYCDCKIFISNSLDEYIIRDLNYQQACVDAYGVGERLITSKSSPVFGGVYKLVGVEKDGFLIPKIKLSENVEKITTPGFKQVWRLFSKKNDQMIADQVTLHHEVIDDSKPLEIFHPEFTWKSQIVDDFYAKPMLVRIFDKGELVYENPNVEEIKSYCLQSVNQLWDEVKRFENPHEYYVDFSKNLWQLKQDLLIKTRDEMQGM